MKSMRWLLSIALIAVLVACTSGPVRRVSEPSARIQQLAVQADGRWSLQLRIENFSSVPMRFESVDLAMTVAAADAGRVQARPGVSIGPESADVVTLILAPNVAGKLAVAEALAAGRSVDYQLTGRIGAVPEEGRLRDFQVERRSALSPAPGLPGVMR